MSALIRALVVLLPWPLKRRVLEVLYGYRVHPTSRIGFAWFFPRRLVMERGSRIGHLTVCKGLEVVELGEHASIGRLNWITAYPLGASPHFAHIAERHPELIVANHAAITNRHIVDCTERVTIGPFATVAGFRSQLLTHSIDLAACRQDAKPIVIGAYAFVGTACTILGGAVVPDHSVVGAASLLRSAYDEPYRLYAGVPAKAVAQLDPEMKYFARTEGFVL
jgi:acetyltransferase-like isoleucine patch superfamily enzyme